MKIRRIGLMLFLFALVPLEGAFGKLWVRHASFEDFSSGTLGDGGVNLYISRAGSVRMIHQWDFNSDGYLDIFVGQDHNMVENEDIMVYRGGENGPVSLMPPLPRQQPVGRLLREIRQRDEGIVRLPSDGGGRSLIADLNGDGWPELVFCNYIHNYSVHMQAFIYWGGPRGYQPERRTELPTLMADDLAAADFNRDGFVDLAFANKGTELGQRFGYDKHLESYIYWNGPTGFEVGKRSSLPTISAAACEAGDLNGDGWPELIFANNNTGVSSLYIYWGGADGFSEQRRRVIEGGDPLGLKLADLNGDSHLDLIVLHEDDRAVIYSGSFNGLASEPWVELPVSGASEVEAGDLNSDGFIDLVFPDSTGDNSFIYWGAASGFAPDNLMNLPTMHASGVALADFNRDGLVDIVFANERDEVSYDINSYLYWNSPEGFHPAHRAELFGFGVVALNAVDMDRDGHQDLVMINRNSGNYGSTDSLIYWGNPRHFYSAASVTELPGYRGAAVPAIADFDRDGYPDIAMPKGWIYYGSAEGYSVQSRRKIFEDDSFKANAVTTADFNRDGYLDLLMPTGAAHAASPSRGVIFWGGENGFDFRRMQEIHLGTRLTLCPAVADLNKDGWLDLVFSDVDDSNFEIFWGGPGGYSEDNLQHLEVQSAGSMEIADLNADGWLDIVLGGGWERKRFGRPSRQSVILWGAPDGFSEERSLQLEAYNSLEQAVADLNKDGYLDLVLTNYHAYHTRTLPVFIYWGAADGSYSESRRSTLPAESSSALTVADLNQDSWLDLVVFNHVKNGDHGAGANIFWGGADGYDYSRRHWLQTFGPHFGVRTDIGNIYNRKLKEVYTSVPLRIPQGEGVVGLSWTAQTPHGTSVRFQIRTSDKKENLDTALWKGPGGGEGSFTEPASHLSVPRNHSWLQYRAILTTPDGGSTPVLEEVTLETE